MLVQQFTGIIYIGSGNKGMKDSNLVQLLKENNAQLTTAESCTGGLIASAITEIAGASAVFEAGFVTYSNNMKESMMPRRA